MSFYPVKDSRILTCPATHTSNSLDGRELRTRNGRPQGCLLASLYDNVDRSKLKADQVSVIIGDNFCCVSIPNYQLHDSHTRSPISKKHFCPGWMARSEWTRSGRAVRDTTVADYSTPGVKTTRRVTYRPPITISPFLLGLSVSYFKQTLWRCGQLWPYLGMGSMGTGLDRDCNAMGDAAEISHRVPSTLIPRSVGRWADMILPGREDPRNCMDLGQSKWDQKFGKIECEFSLYDKRRWKWDDVYLLRGLPHIYSPSLCPPPLPLNLHTTTVDPWRCTWSSVFGMHLETEIEWTQRCT